VNIKLNIVINIILNIMMHLLKYTNNWSFLQNIKGYGNHNDNIPKYYYSTIKNKFN
jgi:hypothetical protein